MNAMRPQRFSDYIGQPALVERLRILVAAARSRGEPCPHTLLSGPPGLGKTTLANILANEMGAHAHIALGPNLEKPADLHGLLARLNPNDVLFIDEIHAIPPRTSECLFPAMEDRVMHVMIDCKTHTRAIQIPLPPFTLIGATTQPGLLEAPLRDRFAANLAMNFYSDADLLTILTANAAKLGVIHETGALNLLASRSRGTPRISNHLLAFARDFATVKADGVLSVDVAEAALRLQGIDAAGLSAQDREYLRVIKETYGGGPVGADALAATMGLKADSVSGVIEPFLLVQGFVARTQRGRKITDKALAHLAAA